MIISKKRYNEDIAKAIEETHKEHYIEDQVRELRRMMFEETERIRNDMRRLEAKMYESTQIYSKYRSTRPIPRDLQI